jgi:hypothetical protein
MLGRKAIWIIGITLAMLLLRAVLIVRAEETAAAPSRMAESAIEELIPLSLQFVDGAIAVLSRGWSEMNEAERENFLQIYDPAGTGEVDEQYVAEVLENYRQIRTTLSAGMPVVYAQQSDTCEGQRLYFTDLTRLYVCPHFFEEKNDLRKARTLIHEMTHKALLVSDRAYYRPTSKQYAKLTPNGSWAAQLPLLGRVLREVLRGDTLYHPDAYAHYALLNAGYNNIYAPVNTDQ